MSESPSAEAAAPTPPLLVVAEFGCAEAGEAELRDRLDRTLAEARAIAGCLHATVWERPAERRFLFATIWTDADAVARWVENDFHRATLMPGFRRWCIEGSFGEFALATDHDRARKCSACGRWTRGRPGWSEAGPSTCRQCGGALGTPSRRVDPASERREDVSHAMTHDRAFVRELTEAVRRACVEAALDGYERASIGGLCHEGAREAAVSAIRQIPLDDVAERCAQSPSRDRG